MVFECNMFRVGSRSGSLHEIYASFVIIVHCAVDNGGVWFSWNRRAKLLEKFDQGDYVAEGLREGDVLALGHGHCNLSL